MGAASDQELLARAVKAPGRLILGPTSTTSAPYYGGLNLGFHSDGEVQWNVRYQPIPEPTSGLLASMSRRSVDYPEIYCLIDGPRWDEDILAGAFSSTTSGASLPFQSPVEARINGTLIPFPVSAWPPMLWAPDDTNESGIYFRRPYPLLSLRHSVALSNIMGAGLPMRWAPSPDSLWATIPFYQCCRVENMIL